jgi:hypothetical protein
VEHKNAGWPRELTLKVGDVLMIIADADGGSNVASARDSSSRMPAPTDRRDAGDDFTTPQAVTALTIGVFAMRGAVPSVTTHPSRRTVTRY